MRSMKSKKHHVCPCSNINSLSTIESAGHITIKLVFNQKTVKSGDKLAVSESGLPDNPGLSANFQFMKHNLAVKNKKAIVFATKQQEQSEVKVHIDSRATTASHCRSNG